MRIFYAFVFLLSLQFFTAQENLSSFNSLTVNYKFHPKYFAFLELQSRGLEEFSYPDYYEIKGGIGYYLTKNHKPFVGIGRYAVYKDHSIDKEEFRVWLQDIIDVKKGIVKFENRFRAEKSWFYEPQKDVHSERMRFRYRLNVSVPLKSNKLEPGTISANVFNEVFFVTPLKPTFARNRFYSGFGYQIDKNFGVATGYIWQREFGATKNRNYHFIFLGFNINIDGTLVEPKYTSPKAD